MKERVIHTEDKKSIFNMDKTWFHKIVQINIFDVTPKKNSVLQVHTDQGTRLGIADACSIKKGYVLEPNLSFFSS